MKIHYQENCEYRFPSISIGFHWLPSILSIFIDIIDFSCFILISVKNIMDKRLALFSKKNISPAVTVNPHSWYPFTTHSVNITSRCICSKSREQVWKLKVSSFKSYRLRSMTSDDNRYNPQQLQGLGLWASIFRQSIIID